MDTVQTLWTYSLVASSAFFGAFWNTGMGDLPAQGICLRPSYQALSLETYFTFSTLTHLRDPASHLQGRLGQSCVADGPTQVPVGLPLSRGVSGVPHRVTSGEGAPTDSSADLAGFGVRPLHAQTRSSRIELEDRAPRRETGRSSVGWSEHFFFQEKHGDSKHDDVNR